MGDTYLLDRGDTESQRLEKQHKLYVKNVGYTVHPSIASGLGTTSRIADVGTGTGIFLVELSQTLPDTCSLDGFDISNVAFLPKNKLPSNVTLNVQDAKKPFPSDLRQSYDLVYVKLITLALEKEDWAIVASNIVDLLKPGGAIQWLEADFLKSSYHMSPDDPTGAVAATDIKIPPTLQYVGNRFTEVNRHRLQDNPSTLREVLVDQGLENMIQETIASDNLPETREEFTRIGCVGVFGWQRQLRAKNDPNAWTLEKATHLQRQIEDEITAGAYYKFDIYVFVGFKPVE